MANWIIVALPRSRTKWLSEWLGFEGRYAVGHDLAVECSSIADFEDALDAVDGTVETGAMLAWRLLRQREGLRIATISRPLPEIVNSFLSKGVQVDVGELIARAEMLEALQGQPGVKSFTFADLASESACATLWEFLLRRDFDFEWWAEMRGKNIQIDLAERISRLRANAPGLEALRAELLAAQRGLSCGLN